MIKNRSIRELVRLGYYVRIGKSVAISKPYTRFLDNLEYLRS